MSVPVWECGSEKTTMFGPQSLQKDADTHVRALLKMADPFGSYRKERKGAECFRTTALRKTHGDHVGMQCLAEKIPLASGSAPADAVEYLTPV